MKWIQNNSVKKLFWAIWLFVTLTIGYSCGLYKYYYDVEMKQIVGKRNVKITMIVIQEVGGGNYTFHPVGQGKNYFSLITLGGSDYKCLPTGFSFKPNMKYSIKAFPQGDRNLPEFFITTDSLGIPAKNK